MNTSKCIVCGTEFTPPKNNPKRMTCGNQSGRCAAKLYAQSTRRSGYYESMTIYGRNWETDYDRRQRR